MNFLDNYFFGKFCFQVTYQTEFFIDKNKDYVVAEHQALLSASRCSFVSSLFPLLPEESAKSSKFSSIGSQFKVPFCSKFLIMHMRSEIFWIYAVLVFIYVVFVYSNNCNLCLRH